VPLDSLPANDAIEPNLEKASYDADVPSSSVSGSSSRAGVYAASIASDSGESQRGDGDVAGGVREGAPKEKSGRGSGPGIGEGMDRAGIEQNPLLGRMARGEGDWEDEEPELAIWYPRESKEDRWREFKPKIS
jgi:hypothetical protein